MDRYIRFAMLTGVARFSKVSIFSDLNNLRDITFDPKFSAICGITNEEIDSYFHVGVECLADRYKMTYEGARQELRKRYDGYHFNEDLVDVYNPFSLINVFSSNKLDNYWFASGTPTYLVRLLEKNPIELRLISGYKIDPLSLASIGIMVEDPIITLFLSGYLTITAYDFDSDLYTLDYPNQEVKQSFLKFLVPYYTRLSDTQTAFAINRFVTAVKEGKPDEFMERLSSLVAGIPYGGKGVTAEDHFQNAVYLVFTLMGYFTRLEDRTSNGRIDMTVETADFVYIFEFKVDKSAQEAMRQIKDHGYWKGFQASGKKNISYCREFRFPHRTNRRFRHPAG